MPELTTVVVDGAKLVCDKARTYPAGATYNLAEAATLHGFTLPPKSVVHVDKAGKVKEAEFPAAANIGGVGLKKGISLALESGTWVARGSLAAKLDLDGLSLRGGDTVWIKADGQLSRAFPSKDTKFGGKTWPESTPFKRTGTTWTPIEDGELVESDDEDDDGDDGDVIEDDGDDDDSDEE